MEAEQFFYEHAGWSYDPVTETSEEGKVKTARLLAAAEARLKAGPYFIQIEPDPETWQGEIPYSGPLWVISLWGVADETRPVILGSVRGVACEHTDPYIRVVTANLALEHLPKENNS